jgi:hypothetical protein
MRVRRSKARRTCDAQFHRIAPSLSDIEGALAASRDAESLASFRDTLGLDYRRFNAALRDLAPEYEPIHNHDGHAQAMAHYVQATGSGTTFPSNGVADQRPAARHWVGGRDR